MKKITNPEELLIEGLEFISPYSGDKYIVGKDSFLDSTTIKKVTRVKNLENIYDNSAFWKYNDKLAEIVFIPNETKVVENFQIY